MKSQIQFATILSVILTAALSTMALAETHAGQILTADLAQQILGCPVKPSSSNGDPDTLNGADWVSRCHYSAAAGGGPTVGILIRHSASPDQAKGIFDSSKSTFKGVDVSGFGVTAYRTTMPAQLNLLKGGNWIIIDCGKFGAPDMAGQEKLAKAVLPKVTF